MNRASKLFDESQRQRINEAIVAAEAETDADLVPVVAMSSGRYERAEDIFGLWLGLLLGLLMWATMPVRSDELGAWGGYSPVFIALCMILAVVAGFIAGSTIAGRFWALRRLFTPTRQMHDHVDAAARRAFFDLSIRRTVGATGVLLYVSIYEQMVAVIADEAVLLELGDDALDDACRRFTLALDRHSLTDALVLAIEDTGRRLADALPRTRQTANELPDALVTLD